MSLWIGSAIVLLLLQTAQYQAQDAKKSDSRPAAPEEVAAPSDDVPRRVDFESKDWNLTHAYIDVFDILRNQNTCSGFYGGPRAATTVLNVFVTQVKTRLLDQKVSFQMGGKRRLIHDTLIGARYRLFDKTVVNVDGSFYQRRTDPMRKYPSDVGSFRAGSRPARALILLHELGHLIEGEDGAWLLPDDANDGTQSKANTLRVQQACRVQLDKLR